MAASFLTNLVCNSFTCVGLPSGLFLSQTVFSAFVYAALYVASLIVSPIVFLSYHRLSVADQVEWDSRVVSTINAVRMASAFFSVLHTEASVFAADYVRTNTPAAQSACALAAGYFVYDLILVLYHRKTLGDSATLLHHVIALATVFGVQSLGANTYFYLLFGFVELTTPFVNARWMLFKSDLKDSPLYLYNGLCMLGGFAVFRIGLLAYIGYFLVNQWSELSQLPLLTLAFFVGGLYPAFTALNVYWFSLMVRIALKALRGSPALEAKGPTGSLPSTSENKSGEAADKEEKDGVKAGEELHSQGASTSVSSSIALSSWVVSSVLAVKARIALRLSAFISVRKLWPSASILTLSTLSFLTASSSVRGDTARSSLLRRLGVPDACDPAAGPYVGYE